MALRTYVLSCLLLLGGCKSAVEKCEEARVAAESVWHAHISALEAGRKVALNTQAECQLELTQKIEPRMSEAAAKAATERYDRGTDGWQRAFVVAQATACANDPDCTRLKHDDSVARDQQADLDEKLKEANTALAALRKPWQETQEVASALRPEPEDVVLMDAKKKSLAAAAACDLR